MGIIFLTEGITRNKKNFFKIRDKHARKIFAKLQTGAMTVTVSEAQRLNTAKLWLSSMQMPFSSELSVTKNLSYIDN